MACLDVGGEQAGGHADDTRPRQYFCHDVGLTFDELKVDIELE